MEDGTASVALMKMTVETRIQENKETSGRCLRKASIFREGCSQNDIKI